MPTLDPIGRVEHPEELDLDPLVVPIVGYTRDKQEIVEEFRFRSVQPTGAALNILRQSRLDADGDLVTPMPQLMAFLDSCVLPEDRETWQGWLDKTNNEIYVEQDTLMAVYRALSEFYSARPTMRRSSSDGGPSSISPTSMAASREKASTSRRSRSA